MSSIYDNWEKLATAVVRREQLRELCYATSMSSRASVSTCPSPLPDSTFNDFSVANGSQVGGTSANVENSQSQALLKPEEIYVNSKPLYSRELSVLQSCSNPPRKLRPGSYYYDKYAGFWGKHGHKPSQIISANLDVGGRLDGYASNTNTLVYINGREITKVELRVLKLVGVKCSRDTHFWMFEDGSYDEEANMPKRGSIWRKPGMRMLCSVFSIPFPPKPSHASGELSVSNYNLYEQMDLKKLLLIGCSRSGTTTIFKQAKFLYKDVPFSEDELDNIKLLIRSNLYGYICKLLEACLRFEVESLDELRRNPSSDSNGGITGYSDADAETVVYSISPRLEAFSDWLLLQSESLDFSSPSFIQQNAPLILDLWKDSAFQETLKRTSEIESLPANANYFLQRAAEVLNPNTTTI